MRTGVDRPVDARLIDTLRSFNRAHTLRIGVLGESFLQTGRPLGPVRLLFEVGPSGASVLDLRRRLHLDSGYVSRLLRDLEQDDLVTVTPDPDDRRRRVVHLTRAGRRAWDELDNRSDALAGSLVEPLTEQQRLRLADALATADHLLGAAAIAFHDIDPRSHEAIAAMTAYFDELAVRFTDGFDPGDTLVGDAPSMRPPSGTFVVARTEYDEVAACGGVLRHDEESAEIKRMWVHPDWRGVGLGRRLLDHLEQRAGDLGYTRIVLDTNATLTEAIAMYEGSGYHAIERYNENPYAMHWFAKRRM